MLPRRPALGCSPAPRRPVAASLTALALLAGLVAHAAPARAKTMDGRLGLGLEASLDGTTALGFRYWPTESFGIAVALGVNALIPTGDDPTKPNPGVRLSGSLGGLYAVHQSTHANLLTGLRVATAITTGDFELVLTGAEPEDGGALFLVEIPLIAEFFLSDNVSVSVGTGVGIAFTPDLRTSPATEEVSPIPGLQIGAATGTVSGSFAVLYYF